MLGDNTTAADIGTREQQAAVDRIRRALAVLAECLRPNDNAEGEWVAKPAGDGVFWHLLGPRYATRAARTVVATVELDSFPGELPTRAERVSAALASLINDTRHLLGRRQPDATDRDTLGRVVREAWVKWALTQPDPKPSWLVPYDELSEPDKEADRQIGGAVMAHLGQVFGPLDLADVTNPNYASVKVSTPGH